MDRLLQLLISALQFSRTEIDGSPQLPFCGEGAGDLLDFYRIEQLSQEEHAVALTQSLG